MSKTKILNKFKFIFQVTFSLVLFMLFGFFSVQVSAQTPSNEYKVKVNLDIKACILDLRTIPEKRFLKTPESKNFSSQSVFEILDDNKSLGSVILSTSDTGDIKLNLCKITNNNAFKPGIYNLKVKGYSHLNKQFSKVAIFQNFNYALAFESDIDKLLAGDTNVDNVVNSYDLSRVKENFYTNQTREDFNRDGLVNTLDLGNLIDNFQLTGD